MMDIWELGRICGGYGLGNRSKPVEKLNLTPASYGSGLHVDPLRSLRQIHFGVGCEHG
jgi:hypothetical protein